MSKIIAFLTAVARLWAMTMEAIGRYEIKKERADYEQDIDSIRNDPIAHANRLYADNGDPEALSGDYPDNPKD